MPQCGYILCEGHMNVMPQCWYNDVLYEQDHDCVKYSSPMILADFMEEFYGRPRDIRILDVAAGTGLVGQKVHMCLMLVARMQYCHQGQF